MKGRCRCRPSPLLLVFLYLLHMIIAAYCIFLHICSFNESLFKLCLCLSAFHSRSCQKSYYLKFNASDGIRITSTRERKAFTALLQVVGM
ncbi:hypothetical protein BJ508DRAFT_10495 [Ascobolus immersus RN42]|uniref:Uncharacterized protein n=1 Tax=Ascobolus immersus RN42 TaxID=1160509 RepID=A0A3N4HWM5_ASCIM|nr:hypothetical protein BJ508DRAFT_10495 [Ascobolus immersus RN42]